MLELFIEQGAKVVLTDLNEEKGKTFAAELGENALFVKQNVTSEEDWATVVAKAEEAFGPVNVLVNNAGITMAKNMLDITVEEYRRIVDINQVSVFLGMKTVMPSMQKAGGGSIVNISSMNGLVAGAVGYTDTKFAVRGMTKAAAIELSSNGHSRKLCTPRCHRYTNGCSRRYKSSRRSIRKTHSIKTCSTTRRSIKHGTILSFR